MFGFWEQNDTALVTWTWFPKPPSKGQQPFGEAGWVQD